MKSLAFFNNKGGVGKTTLLCNVASFLAKRHTKRILIVDADPQCNATQSVFSDAFINTFYSWRNRSSIYSVVQPLAAGKGFTAAIRTDRSPDYQVDVVPGDPRLALSEDLLAEDWSSATAGKVRGLRTTFLFKHLLSQFQAYDYVLFDMGPSLGSINRSVLIAVDFYVVPMSIDIFSIRAVENISSWIASWRSTLERGLELLDDDDDLEVHDTRLLLRFAGYVNQQYTAKRDAEGKRVAVKAYDKIMKDIPGVVRRELVDKLEREKTPNMDYSFGEIPNLHSLIPLSQTTKTPIFELGYREGIVGAHYSKVRDASGIKDIARRRSVIFLGAGVSKNSVGDDNRRPPDWKEFLRTGVMRCRSGRQHIQGLIKQNNLLDACQLIRHHLDEEWLQLVREEFIEPRYRHTQLHEHIFELDLPIIVTTNVEKIYETAAQHLAQGNVVIKNYYDEDLSLMVKGTHRTRAIFRVHGTIDYPERMVFTREDYAKARARYAISYRILDALLVTHSFLFLGCSLTDPDILLLLEQYAVTQSALSPHYVVAPRPVKREAKELIRSNYNMRTIDYNPANNHEELAVGLEQLSQNVRDKREELAANQLW